MRFDLPPVLPPLQPGRVVDSVGTAREKVPSAETSRIAERNADTLEESRRRAQGSTPGQRSPAPKPARAAVTPPPLASSPPGIGDLAVARPDAGASAALPPDAGVTSAAATADPGGSAAPTFTVGIGDDTDEELPDVPLGAETQRRARASAYAGFINVIRDRVRKTWRVHEVYERADPRHRFAGDALTTVVGIRLGPDGSINRLTVQKGSGVAPVDEEATAALRRAGPFPPPADIADADGGLTFEFSFTYDLSQLQFLTATRRALLERWRPSRAFRIGGDRERSTVVRALLKADGSVAQTNQVASAGIDFLDSAAVDAIRPGDRLPPPPDSFRRQPDGSVPVWIEFQHRVGAPSDVRVRRRFAPSQRR